MCSAPSAPQQTNQPGSMKKVFGPILQNMRPGSGGSGGEAGGSASAINAGRTGTPVVGGGGAGGGYSTILGGADDERAPSQKKTLLGQ